MKAAGWLLIAAGISLAIWALSTVTTIHTDMKYIPGIGVQEASDTFNIGLMQRQMMLLESGLAAIITGTIAVCIARLRDAMSEAGTAKFVPLMGPETEEAVPSNG
jgi:hypothetical protein